MLDRITPLILTLNEAPNIGRALGMLGWARDIVVVDSGSTDGTPEIVGRFANARLVTRKFTSHAEQWNFGLQQTDIRTDWVLALDADYVLTEGLVKELAAMESSPGIAGFRARFIYCVEGRPLRAAVYPPVVVLFRRAEARYAQDGHTQRLQINTPLGELKSAIFHDDRKPLDEWLRSQARYMRLEAGKLTEAPFRTLGFADQLRRLIVVAPPVMFLYCLFVRGNILDGYHGLYYALQRTVAESILSMYLAMHLVGPTTSEPT